MQHHGKFSDTAPFRQNLSVAGKWMPGQMQCFFIERSRDNGIDRRLFCQRDGSVEVTVRCIACLATDATWWFVR